MGLWSGVLSRLQPGGRGTPSVVPGVCQATTAHKARASRTTKAQDMPPLHVTTVGIPDHEHLDAGSQANDDRVPSTDGVWWGAALWWVVGLAFAWFAVQQTLWVWTAALLLSAAVMVALGTFYGVVDSRYLRNHG
jgi:hypothetical protein